MVIAIDGLSSNGKTTLAKALAKKLNIKYFNTGAIYRALALLILENKIKEENIPNYLANLNQFSIHFENEQIILNGRDVTNKIFTEEISLKSTKYASLKEAKTIVKKIQQDFLESYDVVMEGRDICTRIAPNADFKFYFYSSFEVRVQRKWELNKDIPKETIEKDLKALDFMDINDGLFIKPLDAINIDVTNMNIEEVLNLLLFYIKNNKKVLRK